MSFNQETVKGSESVRSLFSNLKFAVDAILVGASSRRMQALVAWACLCAMPGTLRSPAGVGLACRGTAGRCGAVAAVAERVAAPPPPPGVERQKKRHTLLLFGFCGTGFYGLQGQDADGDPEKPVVTDLIRSALLDAGFIQPTNWSPLTRTKWLLASRTDKGVHAVCAAASVMLETLAADVEAGDGSQLRDARAGEAEAAAGDWQLSSAALARVNARLPESVRLFGGMRVRKKFNARECASARTYEYLLPASYLGGASSAELDETLRTFEGTHRMHNFASGLRRVKDGARFPPGAPCNPAASEAEWHQRG